LDEASHTFVIIGWLFSDYITGVDSIVGVQGYDIDTDILWMKDMVRNINTTTILEGNRMTKRSSWREQ